MANVTTKVGKQGTRGEKTIIKENVETLAFYRNIIAIVMVGNIYITCSEPIIVVLK